MRCGGLPASELSSGTASQSAITSNIEMRMSAPLPVRVRANSASRIAACAVAPVAISTIGDADPRRPLRAAGDRGEPALGLDQQIIGLAMRVGALVAIAGDGAADQRRIVLAQPLAREAELVHRAGLEVLQQHVGARDQRLELRAAFLGGEIDHHRLLAAVEPDEIAALALGRRVIAAGEIALGPLDLDDGGAGIRQARRAERRGDRLFDGNDGNSLERQHRSSMSSIRSGACRARARR